MKKSNEAVKRKWWRPNGRNARKKTQNRTRNWSDGKKHLDATFWIINRVKSSFSSQKEAVPAHPRHTHEKSDMAWNTQTGLTSIFVGVLIKIKMATLILIGMYFWSQADRVTFTRRILNSSTLYYDLVVFYHFCLFVVVFLFGLLCSTFVRCRFFFKSNYINFLSEQNTEWKEREREKDEKRSASD